VKKPVILFVGTERDVVVEAPRTERQSVVVALRATDSRQLAREDLPPA
jgi:hypothetical protein